MNLDSLSNQMYVVALNEARLQSHEYVTPEHFVYAALMFEAGRDIIENSGGYSEKIKVDLQSFFDDRLYKISEGAPTESFGFTQMFEIAREMARASEKREITLGDVFNAVFSLPESVAAYCLQKHGATRLNVLKYISHGFNEKNHNKAAAAQKNQGRADAEFLRQYATNLTERAKFGKLDPVMAREDVLERATLALCRRIKNNPVFVGEPGVGKTALVEGLAQKVAAGGVPARLKNAQIFEIDMAAVVSGTKYRGDFEERLIKILTAVAAVPNAIVYFDEIHNITGAGAVSGGALDAAGILKPYLTRGEMRFIGSTTYDEYKKHFEKDGALARRFQKIDVNEPSAAECVEMLNAVKPRYERFHNAAFDEAALKACAELAAKYINDRRLPDKAVDVLDETAAFKRLNAETPETARITVADVEAVVAKMAGVPVSSVSNDERVNLRNLERDLNERVFGQENAVTSLSDAVKANRAGLTEKDKPVAAVLFVGPTGVGKTELAKQLAAVLGIKLLRFDMSEYQEQHSVSRLIGSPPGYVGFENGGLLTDEIRKTPYCVLLLDEIEKAHQDVFNVLLQVTDYGALTDNSGRKADFRNVVIIMTSNAGARELGKKTIGFGDEFNDSAIQKEVERVFSPEFRNRLDAIAVFNPINAEMAGRIARKALDELAAILAKKSVTLIYDGEAAEFIAKKGLDKTYGAREIARVVDKDVKKKLADRVLFGEGGEIRLVLKDGEIELT